MMLYDKSTMITDRDCAASAFDFIHLPDKENADTELHQVNVVSLLELEILFLGMLFYIILHA